MYNNVKKINQTTNHGDDKEIKGNENQEEEKSWFSKKGNIFVILGILLSVIFFLYSVMLITGSDLKTLISNEWSILIIIGIITFIVLGIAGGKKFNPLAMKKVVMTVLIVSLLLAGVSTWMKNKNEKGKILARYGYGEYEISLQPNEESEWIHFEPNMRFNYTVNTADCKSDSLIVLYSDESEVAMWSSDPLLKIGRNSPRETKIKFISLSDSLSSIKFRVTKKS